jgi:hypothetical protein
MGEPKDVCFELIVRHFDLASLGPVDPKLDTMARVPRPGKIQTSNLGHASPMVALNTYAHMMAIDEDRGRLVLDSALGPKPAESILRTAES